MNIRHHIGRSQCPLSPLLFIQAEVVSDPLADTVVDSGSVAVRVLVAAGSLMVAVTVLGGAMVDPDDTISVVYGMHPPGNAVPVGKVVGKGRLELVALMVVLPLTATGEADTMVWGPAKADVVPLTTEVE